jgi:hypothetical protein
VAQVVEPNSLSLNPSTTTKKKKKRFQTPDAKTSYLLGLILKIWYPYSGFSSNRINLSPFQNMVPRQHPYLRTGFKKKKKCTVGY